MPENGPPSGSAGGRALVAELETVPWTGRVVDAADGAIYVNAGRDANLRPGQRLVVWTVVKELTDPASGASLGVIERPVGEIEVESVEEKFSVAQTLTAMRIARGEDVDRLLGAVACEVHNIRRRLLHSNLDLCLNLDRDAEGEVRHPNG